MKSYKEKNEREIVLETETHDFQRLGYVILDSLGGYAKPHGYVRVGETLVAAEYEDGLRLIAEFGDGAVDDVLNFGRVEKRRVTGLGG